MTKKSSNQAIINLLNAYQVECAAEYEKNYKGEVGKEKYNTLNTMKAFDFEAEQIGEVLGYSFSVDNQDSELFLRRAIIRAYEKIKHEHDSIPLDLKFFAFHSTLEAIETYLGIHYPLNLKDVENLEICIDFAIDAVESVIRTAPHREEFETHVKESKKAHIEQIINL